MGRDEGGGPQGEQTVNLCQGTLVWASLEHSAVPQERVPNARSYEIAGGFL